MFFETLHSCAFEHNENCSFPANNRLVFSRFFDFREIDQEYTAVSNTQWANKIKAQ